MIARLFGLWWLNACRIVYVVDEEDKFGFTFAIDSAATMVRAVGSVK